MGVTVLKMVCASEFGFFLPVIQAPLHAGLERLEDAKWVGQPDLRLAASAEKKAFSEVFNVTDLYGGRKCLL